MSVTDQDLATARDLVKRWAAANWLWDANDVAIALAEARAAGARDLLTADQVNETVQALYARLGETRAYLGSYERETLLPHHDDCCPRHQQWIKSRAGERDSLRKREADILAALAGLNPDCEDDDR